MKLHVSSGNHHSEIFSLIEGGLLGASPIFFAEFFFRKIPLIFKEVLNNFGVVKKV